MKHTLIPSLLLALMLSACGGGGGSGSGNGSQAGGGGPDQGRDEEKKPNPPPPPSDNQDKVLLSSQPQTIAYYGDSTIWGYQSGSNSARVSVPAPQVFSSELPSSQKVVNRGKNGQTACNLLNGNGGDVLPWRSELIRTDQETATVVILNHGINDAKELTPSQYEDCLEELADIALEENKVVIFETPNPVSNGYESQLATLVERMKAVATARNLEVIDQYAYLPVYLSQNPVANPWPDSEHPSEAVYEVKGKYAAQQYLQMREK